ncbi:hypothetical protein PFDG_05084, partial [Plasmodium falciparum Dd2]
MITFYSGHEQQISIIIKDSHKGDTRNDSVVKYLIYVCSASIILHETPYMVVKPIFTLKIIFLCSE